MIAYQVNGKFVNNVYLALHESWKSGSKIQFYCNDFEFDQFNWSNEPEASIDVLMANHARALRDKYERLVLLWSGGTDSHTIYNVFKANNIHIDEVIIKAEVGSKAFPEENHIWIRNNHWDPTTIITRYDDFDTELRLKDIADENWVWRNKGDLLKYGMTSTGEGVRFLCEKNHAGHNWKAIGGYEKPRLVYRNGHWFHRQMDIVLHPTMGHDYIEHFFFEPLIAIKQSHMVKNAVKKLLETTGQPLYDGDWAEAKWPKTPEGYRAWATACGRHDEVYLGVSHNQKVIHDEVLKTEISTQGSWKGIITADHRLKADVYSDNPAAKNYVQGLHNLTSEFGFINWLSDNGHLRNNSRNLTALNFIWSKEYDLGE